MYYNRMNLLGRFHSGILERFTFFSAFKKLSCRGFSKRDRSSYISGPCDKPLVPLTIGQLLENAAEQYGGREAVVVIHQSIRKSYEQLFSEADEAAAGLIALNLNPGDRIGIWGPNSYEWIVTQYAAARAGLILVNINPAYRSEELRYALNKVGVKALVMAQSFKDEDLHATLIEAVPELSVTRSPIFRSQSVPSLQHVIMLSDNNESHLDRGTYRWSDIINNGRNSSLISKVHNLQKHIENHQAANIQFTSGTTGNPKGATLSHLGIVNNSYFVGLRIGYDEQIHRICLPVPLYHCFGCVIGVLAAAHFGATCILPSPAFSASKAVMAVHQERCTSLYGTPTMFVDMINLKDLKQYDLSCLSTGIMAGAPCLKELVQATIDILHMRDVSILYGMTESSPTTFQTMRTDNVEQRCSSVGYPADHVQVKIIDPGTQQIVAHNTPGEICTRGYNTMIAYWDDQDKTNQTIDRDGWLHTGDIGVIDERGYGYVMGRTKDMIIRGGENVYPKEIEQVLHQHPDVLEAHVVGVADQRLGEEICAWIRCRTHADVSSNELTTFCGRKMASFKVPRYFLFSDRLPMTVTGKVQKYKLRQMAEQRLQHGSSRFDINDG